MNQNFSCKITSHRITALGAIVLVLVQLPLLADSSSPLLAAYYEKYLAICGDKTYAWRNFDTPQEVFSGIRQVGVGKQNQYALTNQDELLAWKNNPSNAYTLMADVKSFHAGRSGLFVIRNDNTLWEIQTKSLLGFGEDLSETSLLLAKNVLTAAIGDSANYYVTHEGTLFVQGLAHRGQYGDGKLTSTESYVQTAEDVTQVVSHTGHALILKNNGSVWGTGGNIYGPLGVHGFGDKAIRWGLVFNGAIAIATGSSHSVAISSDGSLWIWGRNEALQPKQVMKDVRAVAAGSKSTIALANDALWQWNTGNNPKRIMKCK